MCTSCGHNQSDSPLCIFMTFFRKFFGNTTLDILRSEGLSIWVKLVGVNLCAGVFLYLSQVCHSCATSYLFYKLWCLILKQLGLAVPRHSFWSLLVDNLIVDVRSIMCLCKCFFVYASACALRLCHIGGHLLRQHRALFAIVIALHFLSIVALRQLSHQLKLAVR